MSRSGNPYDNAAKCESFHEDAEIRRGVPAGIPQAWPKPTASLERFIEKVYNRQAPSLGPGLSPAGRVRTLTTDCFFCSLRYATSATGDGMKNEGALRKRFPGIAESTGPMCHSRSFNPGPCPAFRTGRYARVIGHAGKNMPCPIVRDEFRPAIPRRVARLHCSPPLHRSFHLGIIAVSNGTIYHRTVTSL